MEKPFKRRIFFIANKYQMQIIQLVFFTTVVPIIITISALSFMFFDITTNLMMGGSQSIPFVRKIIMIALVILPCYIVLLGIWSYKSSNKLTGPIVRITRELDEIVSGKRKEPLHIRDTDYLKDLVDRINVLISKLP
jgi:hypothetical protein